MEKKYKKLIFAVLFLILCSITSVVEYKILHCNPKTELNLTVVDNIIIDNQIPIIYDYDIPIINCSSYKDQEILLNSFAENSLKAFKENKKCGYIYNEVLKDLENQDIKVYAVVIEDPKISHIIPVIKLENNTYYGYDHQFNAIYSTIVRGNIPYNIYSDVEGYYLANGKFQITKWKLIENDARVYIKLAEFKELYNYKSINDNWLFTGLIDQYALKYENNMSLCALYGGN